MNASLARSDSGRESAGTTPRPGSTLELALGVPIEPALLDLAPLAGLSQLHELVIGERSVVSLVPLRNLTALHSLSLLGTTLPAGPNRGCGADPLAAISDLELTALAIPGVATSIHLAPGTGCASLMSAMSAT